LTTSSEILRLENVSFKFSTMTTPTITNVNLTLARGEILGLLGASGCGKTTLLRIIAGFVSPLAGTVAIAGRLVAGRGCYLPPEARNVGMVFQDYALFPHLTVVENIVFGLRSAISNRQARVREMMALVGLVGLENRYPQQLSGGQQQRVALARALVPQPQLLLLDEPLSNLDAQVRLRLREEILDIFKATKTAAIFVTHDRQEALAIADKVAVMHHGKLIQIGTPEEIYYQPNSRFVAQFVTQANFLPAKRRSKFWETEIGLFMDRRQKKSALSTQQSEVGSRKSKVVTHYYAANTGEDDSPPAASRLTTHDSLIEEGELMIREEDFILEPNENGEVAIASRQFLGREYRYRLQTSSGKILYARTSTETILSPGMRVKLSVASQAIEFFPKDTTEEVGSQISVTSDQ